jgi:hypothetical protein
MPTPWRLLLVPVAAAALVTACGGDNSSSSTATVPGQAITTAPGSTVPTPASTGDTAAAPSSEIPGASYEIIVHVGVDDAATIGSRVEDVQLGQDVVLRLTSDSDEDYVVQGYNLDQRVASGVEAQFEFTADKAGMFPVMSRTTNKVYVVLHVQ